MGTLVSAQAPTEELIVKVLLSILCNQETIGTLRSNDDDGNENVKKAIGLISKTTTLLVYHAFLCISLPSLHVYDVKIPDLMFYRG